MIRVNPLVSNFTSGELSPDMLGRADVERFFNGAETIENFFVKPSGGLYRRLGTRFIYPTECGAARLIPFSRSRDDAFLLELGCGGITVTGGEFSLEVNVTPRDYTITSAVLQGITGFRPTGNTDANTSATAPWNANQTLKWRRKTLSGSAELNKNDGVSAGCSGVVCEGPAGPAWTRKRTFAGSLVVDASGSAVSTTRGVENALEDNLVTIIDNAAGSPYFSTLGSWSTESASGQYGTNFKRASDSSPGTKVASFYPWLSVAGTYQVYAWWVAGSSRSDSVPVVITHAGGTDTIYVNQRINGSTFHLLGTFDFPAGGAGSVQFVNGGNGYTAADAVQFVRTSPLCVPGFPSSAAITPTIRDVNHWRANPTSTGLPEVTPLIFTDDGLYPAGAVVSPRPGIFRQVADLTTVSLLGTGCVAGGTATRHYTTGSATEALLEPVPIDTALFSGPAAVIGSGASTVRDITSATALAPESTAPATITGTFKKANLDYYITGGQPYSTATLTVEFILLYKGDATPYAHSEDYTISFDAFGEFSGDFEIPWITTQVAGHPAITTLASVTHDGQTVTANT